MNITFSSGESLEIDDLDALHLASILKVHVERNVKFSSILLKQGDPENDFEHYRSLVNMAEEDANDYAIVKEILKSICQI